MEQKQLRYWEDPYIIKENKEDGHNNAFAYPDKKSAFAQGEAPLKRSLNGNWKFYWQKGLAKVDTSYTAADYDDSSWDDTTVPSLWQLKGYGKPLYLCSFLPGGLSKNEKEIPKINERINALLKQSVKFHKN